MKTHHYKMDVNSKNIYSGKHDLIRERKGGREEGKRKAHIKVILKTKEIFPSGTKCKNMGLWGGKKKLE